MATTEEQKNRDYYAQLQECMRRDPENFEGKLKAALADGFDINYADENGMTLLHWAVLPVEEQKNRYYYARLLDCLRHDPKNFEKELKAALADGFNINYADKNGMTLLHWAVQQ